MFQAVASTTNVSTTKAAKKKYSLTGLKARLRAAIRAASAPIQNFIGHSSSEQSLRPHAQHDEQEAERHRRRERCAEKHQHDRLGYAENEAGHQGARHAA